MRKRVKPTKLMWEIILRLDYRYKQYFDINIYIFARRKERKMWKRTHEEARSNMADKFLHRNFSSFFPYFPSVANSRARHSNLPFGRLASMPFWSHPNVLEFTLKGCSEGAGGQIGPRGLAEGARSSSTAGSGVTSWTEWGKRIQGWNGGGERVRNSRAAFYDDGSFTRKSQCSATVLAACRNVHPLTFSVTRLSQVGYLSHLCIKQSNVWRSQGTASLSVLVSAFPDTWRRFSLSIICTILGNRAISIDTFCVHAFLTYLKYIYYLKNTLIFFLYLSSLSVCKQSVGICKVFAKCSKFHITSIANGTINNINSGYHVSKLERLFLVNEKK